MNLTDEILDNAEKEKLKQLLKDNLRIRIEKSFTGVSITILFDNEIIDYVEL